MGGGSLPGETLASAGVAVGTGTATRLLGALRRGDPPVIARIEDDRVVIDLRTVDPAALGELARAIERARRVVG